MPERKQMITEVAVARGDITQMFVDAIVNAANESLLGGGGMDGAIHRAAGPDLLAECRTLNGCRTGEAKITKGYRLPAKHVIHTVGPIYDRGGEMEARMLFSCYISCLLLAKKHGLKSIAFPCISTGIFGYPKKEAARIAVDSVNGFLKNYPGVFTRVIFVTFDQENYEIYRGLLPTG